MTMAWRRHWPQRGLPSLHRLFVARRRDRMKLRFLPHLLDVGAAALELRRQLTRPDDALDVFAAPAMVASHQRLCAARLAGVTLAADIDGGSHRLHLPTQNPKLQRRIHGEVIPTNRL